MCGFSSWPAPPLGRSAGRRRWGRCTGRSSAGRSCTLHWDTDACTALCPPYHDTPATDFSFSITATTDRLTSYQHYWPETQRCESPSTHSLHAACAVCVSRRGQRSPLRAEGMNLFWTWQQKRPRCSPRHLQVWWNHHADSRSECRINHGPDSTTNLQLPETTWLMNLNSSLWYLMSESWL